MRLSIKILTFLGLSFIICIIGLYTFAFFSPKIELKSANQFSFYDDNEQLVFQGSGSQEWVSIDDISPYVIDAVISTEDRNFYRHNGFDYLRIIGAFFSNFRANNIVQGASTISQQYIKNMFLTFDKTWSRKIEEAFLTLKMEVHYSKDQILEGYLNTIDYGNGNYGIGNASRFYFNKNAGELTLEESIILAGIPKSPNNYNPISNMDRALNRARIVTEAMVNNKKLDEEKAENLFTSEPEIHGQRSVNNLQTLMYYQNSVISELRTITDIPVSLLASGGLKIYTNLSMDAQTELENAIKNNMSGTDFQVASIIVEPKSGKIKALAGGYDYAVSQFNRATQASRMVGSTMKPLLYYAALENNLVSSSTFLSEPTSFVFSNNKTYSPSNAGDRYANKNVTMAAAMSISDNIFAVKTHLFLGEEVLVDVAKRMGIQTRLQPIPSLALGSNEISMIDFARAYSTLASGGFKNDLYFISRVEDLQGQILYERNPKTDLVLNQNYVYILNELMTTPYNSAFNDYGMPTFLNFASRLGRKYAIKTGTTPVDRWLVGYNPDLLMLVWNGHDDNSPLANAVGDVSKAIWTETMEAILKDSGNNWYEQPENVVGVIQNSITGELTTSNRRAYVFYYLKGTEPREVAVSNQRR